MAVFLMIPKEVDNNQNILPDRVEWLNYPDRIYPMIRYGDNPINYLYGVFHFLVAALDQVNWFVGHGRTDCKKNDS